MDYDYQLIQIAPEFFDKYPNPPYIEILIKSKRTYNCLLFQTHYDYFICVPYRSNMTHNNGYHFTSSVRSQTKKSGLDYSKMLIISDPAMIADTAAIIDKDEYIETIQNIDSIVNGALRYLEDYIKVHSNSLHISKKNYRIKYGYSSLKYFHSELGIDT